MRECLNCKKEYEHKREASKFCSDKCRVKYNRDNPKEKVTKLQMQVLYNMAISALTELNNQKPVNLPADYLKFDKVAVLKQDGSIEPLKFGGPQIALKSFEEWKTEKRECETEENWEKIKAGIQSASNLSQKQKDLLIKYS